MNSANKVEHFATLFNHTFLPYGLALHHSLMQQHEAFHLWILCMDQIAYDQLIQLALPYVTLIPLEEIETDRLKKVKSSRSIGEYCWTLTPFLPQIVLDQSPEMDRVTYLDSDLYFFDRPSYLLKEFSESEKHVLITEHAYAPEYDQSDSNGRFCVQFMTFKNTYEAREVMAWWQDRCVEWCFQRSEDGKFGDQKYLDSWPTLFSEKVHILQQTEKTLAPWNEYYFERMQGKDLHPVFFHFHGLRLIAHNKIRLYLNYRIGPFGKNLYCEYIRAFREGLDLIRKQGWDIPVIKNDPYKFPIHVNLIMKLKNLVQYTKYIPLAP